jgi:hypothetical protein
MANAIGCLMAAAIFTLLSVTDDHAQSGTPSSPWTITRTDISGTWFDSQLMTAKTSVVQHGSEFSATGSGVPDDGPLVGVEFTPSGNGHIAGTSLDMNYSFKFRNGASGVGHCTGVLRKDDVIAWHCKDSNKFESKPTWIASPESWPTLCPVR